MRRRSLRIPSLGLIFVAVFPCAIHAATFDGGFMIGNARGGPTPAYPGIDPAVVDGYQVSGLTSGDVVTMDFSGTNLRVHATQSGLQVPDCIANTVTITATGASVTFFPAVAGANNSHTANVTILVNSLASHIIRFRSFDLKCSATSTAKVDGFDFNEFRQRFLGYGGHTPLDPDCDFATDGGSGGVVDAFDFNVFRAEYLCGVNPPLPPGSCEQTQCMPQCNQ